MSHSDLWTELKEFPHWSYIPVEARCNRSQGYLASSEPSCPTTPSPGYPKTPYQMIWKLSWPRVDEKTRTWYSPSMLSGSRMVTVKKNLLRSLHCISRSLTHRRVWAEYDASNCRPDEILAWNRKGSVSKHWELCHVKAENPSREKAEYMSMGNTPRSRNCDEHFLSPQEYSNPHFNLGGNYISHDGGDFRGLLVSYERNLQRNGNWQVLRFCFIS